MKSTPDVCHFGIVLIPGFSLMAFASTVEPLRSANLMSDTLHYRWTYISPNASRVSSSSGLDVLTKLLAGKDVEFDVIVVCGGLSCESYVDERLFGFLRQSARRGSIVGAISTASFVLARAGLLNDRRCTVHWDYLEAFKEAYPELDVREELFVVDRGIFTCAGGIAAMDVMLHFIRSRQGDALANLVADQFIHGQVRQSRDGQRMTMRNRIGIAQPMMVKAIELMEKSTAMRPNAKGIAKSLNISTRQLERLFKRYLKSPPSKYYMKIRLERARKLLQRTTLPVIEVAVACGFTSASHFSKCYRQQFGTVPTADRQQISSFRG